MKAILTLNIIYAFVVYSLDTISMLGMLSLAELIGDAAFTGSVTAARDIHSVCSSITPMLLFALVRVGINKYSRYSRLISVILFPIDY